MAPYAPSAYMAMGGVVEPAIPAAGGSSGVLTERSPA